MEVSGSKTNSEQSSAVFSIKRMNEIIAAVRDVADNLKVAESSQRLQQISSTLLKFVVKVGLVGLTNSGKSTTQNALMGLDILPASFRRETVCPVCVEHNPRPKNVDSPGELYGREAADDNLVHLASGVDSVQAFISKLNKDARKDGSRFSELVLHAPVLCLSSPGKEMVNLEIYDTPGVSEKSNSVATSYATVALKSLAAIILVIGADSVDAENLTDFIVQIERAHPNIMSVEQSRMLVLINKYDLCYNEENSKACRWDPEMLVESMTQHIGVTREQVLCFSATSALKARQWQKNPAAVDKYKYSETFLKLRHTTEKAAIASIEDYSPENVLKLAAVLERFSRIREVEAKLLKTLFVSDPVILFRSTVSDSCCEIDKIKAVAVERIKSLQLDENQLEKLIQQLNDLLQKYCEDNNAVLASSSDSLQNFVESVKVSASALESKIVSEASTIQLGLQGQFDVKQELATRVSSARKEVYQIAESKVRELLEKSGNDMKAKLIKYVEDFLKKVKEDVASYQLTDYLQLESINPNTLVENLSLPALAQSPVFITQSIDSAVDALILPRTVTRQRNEQRTRRVSTGRRYGLFGPKEHEHIPYTEVVNYQVTVHEASIDGLSRAFKQLATESATHVRNAIEKALKELISKLSKTLSNNLQQLSEQPLSRLQSELEGKVRSRNDLEQKVKFLDGKHKELSDTLRNSLPAHDPSVDTALAAASTADNTVMLTHQQDAAAAKHPVSTVTIEQLVEHVGISRELLEKECSSDHLDKVGALVLNWLQLARALKLTEPEIQNIESRHMYDNVMRAQAVLETWHRAHIFNATYHHLIDVCLELKQGDLAQKICSMLQEDASRRGDTRDQ